MKNSYTNNEQYYRKKYIRPKRIKQKHSSPYKLVVLIVCFLILIFVLPYSFNLFIKDIFIGNKNNINIDYEKVMHPALSMLPKDESIRGGYLSMSSEIDTPLMVDIPEGFQRIRLRNELLELAENYKKIHPAVYVWEYDGKSYVDINANEPFPAASIIKVPVLIEMFRNIENQKFSLYDTMILEDYYRASGSGKLQYSQSGVSHTLHHLAKIMIENSDNSSTNMIMSKIGGMPEVNNAIHSWGLKTTTVNNLLPDLDGTNLTTAREMAKMFYNLDMTGILSNESKKQIASYLVNVKNTRLLKAGLPDSAIILHKTGDIGFMIGDAGIVKAENGKKYIVVILALRPYNNLQGKEFIVKASTLIYNNLAN